jgi:hypothetical protein
MGVGGGIGPVIGVRGAISAGWRSVGGRNGSWQGWDGAPSGLPNGAGVGDRVEGLGASTDRVRAFRRICLKLQLGTGGPSPVVNSYFTRDFTNDFKSLRVSGCR